MVTTRKQTEINQASIAHCIAPCDCTLKTHDGHEWSILQGEDVYSCKSDSSSDTYYMTWDFDRSEWRCSCPATKPCKHIRALCQIIQARKEQEQAQRLESVGLTVEGFHQHMQAVNECIATEKEQEQARPDAYEIDGHIVRWDDLFSAWACTCQEVEGGIEYGEECEHTRTADLLAKKARGEWRPCAQCENRTLQHICGRCQLADAA